jgi:hypothetical protein
VLAGALTFLYSVSFIILVSEPLSSFCLLANGLLASAVLVALYERVRATDSSFALWALLLGLAGAIGSPRCMAAMTWPLCSTRMARSIPTCPAPWTRADSSLSA